MRYDEIYSKSDAGREEIVTRARKLSPALRSILLIVDGQRSAGELRRLAAGLHAPDDAIEQLLALGLIATANSLPPQAVPASAGAQQYIVLKGLMSEAVRQYLGLRGYFYQLKIERCANAAELAALLPELRAAVGKAKGEAFAEQWASTVRDVAAL